MPVMPNGTFQNIDEVKGNLRFCENVSRAMRELASPEEMPAYARTMLADLDTEAAECRAVIDEYERRISV